jgi:outer membrane protein assembly factor BamE (lipoprotein component of BamABCDE complex)
MKINVYCPPVFDRVQQQICWGIMALLLMLSSGCASVGHSFPASQVPTIRIGETTQNDIYTTFGAPWRTGVDNGMKTWTYGDYRYGLFNDSSTEDLVIKFDKRGVVSSFTYNTTKRSK